MKADLLVKYGGVAPKMAEEAHALAIDKVYSNCNLSWILEIFCFYFLHSFVALKVVQQALDNANLREDNLSAVAVTIGPGLSLCLRGNIFFFK
jgi:N6-L-threonylcarbamoyladenine synthase